MTTTTTIGEEELEEATSKQEDGRFSFNEIYTYTLTLEDTRHHSLIKADRQAGSKEALKVLCCEKNSALLHWGR